MEFDTCVIIATDTDIVAARQKGRELALQLGFSSTDLALIATAISELARNIITYAGQGEIGLRIIRKNGERGIAVMARDHGPGIEDIDKAMEDGYSTSRSLGLGLPGVKRLMDEFEIVSKPGNGTTVTVKKWKR
ncbi:MAG: anti-sigma regulatory factor [Deltaproteobacteria bacterium]|nr:anti-sigma regulatory factor [Deltaproteobacteria bacterium]